MVFMFKNRINGKKARFLTECRMKGTAIDISFQQAAWAEANYRRGLNRKSIYKDARI